MDIILNLDLVSVGLTIAGIGILGFTVFFNNPKSQTNKSFLYFALAASFWSTVNYLSYRVGDAGLILWSLRLVMFSAVWYSFFLFQLFYIFPKENFQFSNFFKYALLPITELVSILCLSPLVIKNLAYVAPMGQVSTANVGPGILIFGITVFGLIGGAIIVLAKKTIQAKGLEQIQYRLVGVGATITFVLHLTFNFILAAFFNNPRFIPFGAVFTFPLIAFTTYAILRHHLLNLKVVATEALVFLLATAMLFEIILSKDMFSLFLRFCLFLLIVAVGILLIKSVVKEVEQRQQLEVLTKKLEDANEKLKALDQARSEFITIASHQLRTPPATIKWYLGAMLSGDYGKFKKDQQEILAKTNRTNNALISLIDDMLNVSRIERGKMEFLFEEAELLPLAQMTYEQLIPQALERKLELSFMPPKKPLPKIMVDKEKIRQVMNNLIDNALKYTKEGSVKVKLWQEGEEIKFSVTDTGKGISQEESSTIFEKFSRGKESVRQSAGLGLGLYVAKIVIEQHHGKIWAESPGIGKGATFIFSLPIHSDLKATTLLDLTQNQAKETFISV